MTAETCPRCWSAECLRWKTLAVDVDTFYRDLDRDDCASRTAARAESAELARDGLAADLARVTAERDALKKGMAVLQREASKVHRCQAHGGKTSGPCNLCDCDANAEKLVRVRELLSENGCDCECDHDHGDHDDDCDECFPCRVALAIIEVSP